VVVLFETHPAYAAHDPGSWHPERPARLTAVREGAALAGLGDDLVAVTPRPATRDELLRVHTAAHLDDLERACRNGPHAIDADTHVVPASWDAALLAAGAGLDAVERLQRGEASAAFCAVRPPGHHASPSRAMGFCLLNSAAVAAAALADGDGGARVAVVDYDAHHGNGTQEAFWRDPRVLYVSLHEYGPPLVYPGTGAAGERGDGDGFGTTVNVPMPPGAGGDDYRRAFDDLVAPALARFAPDWVLLSAGFDAHRADPLMDLDLTADDFGDLAARCVAAAPQTGRVVAFLEGGYDLRALTESTAATIAALATG
jgi:acetoin utilization deacetylase AcuC-like enzyme